MRRPLVLKSMKQGFGHGQRGRRGRCGLLIQAEYYSLARGTSEARGAVKALAGPVGVPRPVATLAPAKAPALAEAWMGPLTGGRETNAPSARAAPPSKIVGPRKSGDIMERWSRKFIKGRSEAERKDEPNWRGVSRARKISKPCAASTAAGASTNSGNTASTPTRPEMIPSPWPPDRRILAHAPTHQRKFSRRRIASPQ